MVKGPTFPLGQLLGLEGCIIFQIIVNVHEYQMHMAHEIERHREMNLCEYPWLLLS